MRLRACNPPRQRALAAAEALVRLATLPLLAPAFTHRPRYDRSPTCCCVADLRRSAAALFALQCGQRCKFLPPVCTHPISSSPLISKLQNGICAIKRLLQLISISPSQMLLPVQRDYCFGCRVLSVILLALTEGDEGGILKYRPDCKPHHEGDASRRRHVRSALSRPCRPPSHPSATSCIGWAASAPDCSASALAPLPPSCCNPAGAPSSSGPAGSTSAAAAPAPSLPALLLPP